MKKSLLFPFLFCVFANFSFSENISPHLCQPLIDHLMEVNSEWQNHNRNFKEFQFPIDFKNERERIQMHLRLVESILSERGTEHLSFAQKVNRKCRLQELREYWLVGNFPQNTFHTQRQPYFVDIYGTACAVGHLMQTSGAFQTVKQIVEENNFGYVRELTDYPKLLEWAEVNGFTLEELAWIQPGYPPMEQVIYPVGNGGPANGQVNVMLSNSSSTPIGVVMAGDFTEIDGIAANSIATWDGENWHTYGEGVIGEIHSMTLFMGRLVIGGEFMLPGIQGQVNLATWDNGEWQPMQLGDMEGKVLAVYSMYQDLYVGGDFGKINGAEMPFIARYDLGTATWSQDGEVGGEVIEGLFTVDAPVRCFERNLQHLLVGGDFTKMAFFVDHPTFQPIPTQYLAYWDPSEKNWLSNTFSGSYQPVLASIVFNGRLVVGGDFQEPNPVANLDAGVWFYDGNYFSAMGDGIVHGFLTHNNRLILYGGFALDPVVGIYIGGIGELFYSGDYSGEIGFVADNTVRAATSYQGNAYFAGDFTTVNDKPRNGLFYSPLNGTTPIDETIKDAFKVYQSNGHLFLKRGTVSNEVELNIYTIQGQKIMNKTLALGEENIKLSLEPFPSGIYVYQINGDKVNVSGKFFR